MPVLLALLLAAAPDAGPVVKIRLEVWNAYAESIFTAAYSDPDGSDFGWEPEIVLPSTRLPTAGHATAELTAPLGEAKYLRLTVRSLGDDHSWVVRIPFDHSGTYVIGYTWDVAEGAFAVRDGWKPNKGHH